MIYFGAKPQGTKYKNKNNKRKCNIIKKNKKTRKLYTNIKIYYLKMNGKNYAKNNTPPLRKKSEHCKIKVCVYIPSIFASLFHCNLNKSKIMFLYSQLQN